MPSIPTKTDTGRFTNEACSEDYRLCKGDDHIHDDNNVKIHPPTLSEPLAIVGMAMRLPGGVNSAESFWDLMNSKKDGLCKVPECRYNVEAFCDPNKLGSVRTKFGYFLQDDPARFDNAFFSISGYEASKLDPQQRLLLEVIWECMENGGQIGWQGKNIGCYVGVFGEDWLDMSSKDTQAINRYHVLSTGDFALSNRMSYEFDLHGPSVTLKTGCSSSLVGMHDACQAILAGDCESAIVAGTNLILSPTMTTTMSDNMVLSPSGLCRTFDAKADGYGRGEAINALYIKRLDDAIRDGDPVRAVVRATATNCDGRTPSITTPGSDSQVELVKMAYSKAGIRPEEIGKTAYFECHGTGTIMGDTAETTGVGRVFGKGGILIGAVKPNVGHSEGSSGITSVQKAVLALEHRTIPPNIHFSEPNPKIPFEDYKLQVPTEATPWPEDRLERISVNCFGIGGSNAHVILDSAASYFNPAAQEGSSAIKLLVTSTKDQDALGRRIDCLTHFVRQNEPNEADLAYTLGERREHLSHRAFAILDPKQPLLPESFTKSQHPVHDVCFVFTGQGAQWTGMGKGLSQFPVFDETIQELDCILSSIQEPPSWSIREELADGSRVNETYLSQPLCTALQIVLVRLMRSWGVRPSSVVGHSSGEIAAAYAAGAITAKAAILLAYYRGIVVSQLSTCGGMAAVGMSEPEARSHLQDGVEIACVNSPESVTLSGDGDALEAVLESIRGSRPDTFCRRLPVKVAYHSYHMQAVGARYKECIEPHIIPSSSMVAMYSSVDCQVIEDPQQLDSEYWCRNLEQPVQFWRALHNRIKSGTDRSLLVEIGPHSALSASIRQTIQGAVERGKGIDYIPTLVRGDDPSRSMLKAAGNLYIRSVPVRLAAINGPGTVLNNVPSYPWQRDIKLWSESRMTHAWRFREYPHHELLGSRCLESSTLEPAWRNLLRIDTVSWVWQHKLDNKIVFPCAAFVAMIGEAIRQTTSSETYSIENLILKSPLILEDTASTEILTTFRCEKLSDFADSGWFDFNVAAYDGQKWVRHCSGKARPGCSQPQAAPNIRPFNRPVSSDYWYQALRKRGLNYGQRFQGLKAVTASPLKSQAHATISDDRSLHESNYTVHPTVIDHALQLLSVASCQGLTYRSGKRGVPASIGRLYVGRGALDMAVSATSDMKGAMTRGDVLVSVANELAMSIQDALFFTLENDDDAARKIPLASQAYWRQDIDTVPLQSLLPLPSHERHDKIALWEKLSLLYIIQTAEDLMHVQPSADHLDRYKSWILHRVEQINHSNNSMFPKQKDWLGLTSGARCELMESIHHEIGPGDMGAVAEAARKLFENCTDIMTERKHALDVLHEGGALDRLYKLQAGWTDWSRFLALLGHSNPRLRILEIGAGTGSTTSLLLDHLKSQSGTRLYSTYMYTDISSGFLVHAKEKLAGTPGMEYRTLDISRPPLEQGFQAGDFDLIVASNVFHATPNIHDTLVNVHTLLRPGGYLLLQELSPELKYINYIMGVLPGWWVGEDEGRTKEPYIPPSEWQTKLLDAGFSGIDAMSFDNEPPFNLSTTMISRRPSSLPDPNPVYILHDGSFPDMAHLIAKQLQKEGLEVFWTTLEQPPPSTGIILSLLDATRPFLATMSPDEYGFLQRILADEKCTRIVWVTQPAQFSCQNPHFGLIHGFARTIRYELGLDFAVIEMDHWDPRSLDGVSQIVRKLDARSTGVIDGKLEYEFMIHEGKVHISRFEWLALEDVPTNYLSRPATQTLDIGSYGILDTVRWAPTNVEDPMDGQVEVGIEYVGLNFRDMMVSLGVMGSKEELGFEAAGIITRIGNEVQGLQEGDRVIVLDLGTLCERKVTSQKKCVPIPPDLSLQDAATMSAVFLTAIYALIDVGQLEEGQSVLIHSACGGVGLAAIQICQMKGAIIYATVGSDDKADYLTSEIGIPKNRIFNSRDDSFVRDLMRETQNRGVDIVLNSLAGELLHASWNCVAKFGKMLELGKRDFLGHGILPMSNFASNRSFIGVDVLQLAQECPEKIERLFRKLIALYEARHIRPIRPVSVFAAADITQAFRYMQTGTHKGKIVVEMHGNKGISGQACEASLTLSPTSSYLLVGGLGGIGRVVSQWMVDRGARNFVFLSRTAGQSDSDRGFLEDLESQGCHVIPVVGSATDINDIKRAVALCPNGIAGAIHLSAVLKDRDFGKMSHEEWRKCVEPKADGAWRLHQALQSTPLDFFVVVGSVIGLGGNSGQANYAAANSFLDSLVSYRRSKGLVASTLNLGVIDGIGLVSKDRKLMDWARVGSLRFVDEDEVLKALDVAIRRSRLVEDRSSEALKSSVLPIGFSNTKPLSELGVRPLWCNDARFGQYANVENTMDQTPVSEIDRIREFLVQAEADPSILDNESSEELIRQELGRLIGSHVPHAQGYSADEWDNTPIDSLMTIEIRNWFRRNLGLEVSAVDISKAGTVGGLSKVTMKALREKVGRGSAS